MADTPLDDRRFTDREVHEILKKAVEKSPSRALARSEGLSLAELKTIGAEVGIEPARLEEAARKVTRVGGRRPNWLIGGPTVLNVERTVDGEIDPSDTPQVLSVIRRVMGRTGEVSDIRGSLEWSEKGDSGERHVTVSSRDGSTTVSGTATLTNAVVLTYLPAGIMGIFGSVIGISQAAEADSSGGVFFFLLIIPVLYLILRTILGKISRSESARLEQVVDELARLTEEPDS